MLRLIISVLVLVTLMPDWAFGQPRTRMAEVSLISERSQVQAGETFYAAFDMKLTPGWHVYWRNPGDSGLPPVVMWDEGSGEGAGEFIWPAPHELVVIEDELLDYGYDDRLVLPFRVSVPADASGAIALSGELRYLICEEVCIPEEALFNLSLLVGDRPIVNEASGQVIAEWISQTPVGFEGEARLVADNDTSWTLSLAGDDLVDVTEARFFPYQDEIKHAAAQPLSTGPNGLSLILTPSIVPELGDALEGVLVVARAGTERVAFEISAPVGSEILAGTQGQPGSSGYAGLGVNLFAIAALALLGGLILNLMPCVLPVLSIKAVGMVTAAASGKASEIKRHGLWYTGGVVSSFLLIAGAFVTLRSAGEFLPIGFQLQYPVIVSGLALLMFVIGLWLLGVFQLGGSFQNMGGTLAERGGASGAFFTGVLAAVVGAPCIGPFLGAALGAVATQSALIVFLVFGLVGLGLALPFLALSFVPRLQEILPRPGPWMDRMKQFFAFPMFLTSVWLLSVLGNQAGSGAVVWTAAGAALIGFGIWVLTTRGGRFKVLGIGFGVLLLVAGGVVPAWASLRGVPKQAGGQVAYAPDHPGVVWSEADVDKMLSEGRGVFVDFTASWCATCQVNKWRTLKTARVQQAFLDNDIVFMVADYTNRDPAISAALQKYNRPGVPMYLYYAPGSRSPKVLPQLLSIDLILDEIEA